MSAVQRLQAELDEYDNDELVETISSLEGENDDLRRAVRDWKAWEGRYWALLEEAEAARPRKIDGGTESRNMPDGTIVVDCCGRPWIASEGGWWRLTKDVTFGRLTWLPPLAAPHTIIHTPNKEES
jgi:hypothetical protein